ncbi:MAG TPA: 2-C-methyl-D-erythritol 2,4-cyclodiphosphate synthase [Candidatus Acidoferrum sp.]
MIGIFEKFSDKARTAQNWAFLVALRENQLEVGLHHLLAGIQCANPAMFAEVDVGQLGFSPLEVSDVEKVQQEMQKLYMRAQISRAAKRPDEARAFSFPFAPGSKLVLQAAGDGANSLGARTIGTPHLLLGVFKADSEMRAKLERVNLNESRILSFCQEYKEESEGTSVRETIDDMRGRKFRSGIGYDLHRLAEGRKLIVGGIELPFDKGSVGHSDGDVLAHALCDALLGAAGLGDIGTHFPDADPMWKGANSLRFLEHARKLLDEKLFVIEHVDAVVILEKPKLGPHFPKMREALAGALSVPTDKIHLKAKTNEGVDAVGRGEAIAAHVVATLSQ